jgi:prepilin-type N-terminal cleavage/methylation domain-containing protein
MRTHADSTNLHASDAGFSMIELSVVVTISVIVAALAIPIFSSMARNLRGDGEMQSLRSTLVQAKTRAAAGFSRARLRANLTARTFQLELWNKTTSAWDLEGGAQNLPDGVNFGFGSISTPPPNTQSSIAQAATCTDGAGADIDDTACIIFNSRGIPVDSTGTALASGDAVYVNNGASAFSVTVGRTGLIRGWRCDLSANPSWQGR